MKKQPGLYAHCFFLPPRRQFQRNSTRSFKTTPFCNATSACQSFSCCKPISRTNRSGFPWICSCPAPSSLSGGGAQGYRHFRQEAISRLAHDFDAMDADRTLKTSLGEGRNTGVGAANGSAGAYAMVVVGDKPNLY